MGSPSTFSLESLPIWKGVQSKPEFELAPFQLSVHQKGYIYQTTEGRVLQEIQRAYADSAYQFITSPPGSSAWSTRLGNTYISYVEDCLPSLSRKSVLEIGAGSLFTARHFTGKYQMSRYLVIDPAIKQGMVPSESTIEVRKEYFRAEGLGSRFDLVLSFNTLEHVDDTETFLDSIACVLKPEGKVILVFPNISDQFLRGDLNALLHEHINYFTQESAAQLFRKSGFNLLRCDTFEETLYFLLEVGKPGGKGGQIDSKEVLGNLSVTIPRNLRIASDSIREDLRLGRKVCFHGACNGLNNFTHLSGITPTEDFLVFDSDSSKVNKYLPTIDTPILSAEHPSYKTCDVVSIAAMTYCNEIRKLIREKHGISENKIRPLFWR